MKKEANKNILNIQYFKYSLSYWVSNSLRFKGTNVMIHTFILIETIGEQYIDSILLCEATLNQRLKYLQISVRLLVTLVASSSLSFGSSSFQHQCINYSLGICQFHKYNETRQSTPLWIIEKLYNLQYDWIYRCNLCISWVNAIIDQACCNIFNRGKELSQTYSWISYPFRSSYWEFSCCAALWGRF